VSYRARAYPFPVLSSFSNDFGNDAYFRAEVSLAVCESNPQQIELAYEIEHSSNWLDEYIVDRRARLLLDVECRATLSREYIELQAFKGTCTFPAGALYGTVVVTPLIVARRDDDDYQPEGIDEEFGSAIFSVREGDILGVGESTRFDLEFARTLERNLITIQYSNDAVERDAYRFELTGERITVVVSDTLRGAIGHMRANATLRPFLYMSIYKDCIAAALDHMAAEGGGLDTERPWTRALQRKLDEIDRSLGTDAEYRQISAQLLVGSRGVKQVEATIV